MFPINKKCLSFNVTLLVFAFIGILLAACDSGGSSGSNSPNTAQQPTVQDEQCTSVQGTPTPQNVVTPNTSTWMVDCKTNNESYTVDVQILNDGSIAIPLFEQMATPHGSCVLDATPALNEGGEYLRLDHCQTEAVLALEVFKAPAGSLQITVYEFSGLSGHQFGTQLNNRVFINFDSGKLSFTKTCTNVTDPSTCKIQKR